MEHQDNIEFDMRLIINRVIKYVVEGGAVAVAAFVIPHKQLSVNEVIMIALTAAAIFALLDYFAPSVGASARQGAGFALGAQVVGFPGLKLPGGVTVPGIPPVA